MEGSVIFALSLTLLAGLSTGIGSTIAFFVRKPKIGYLAFALGLSAGVMVYISFMELLPHGMETIGQWAVLVFFLGIGFIGLIDMLVPEVENPHNYDNMEMGSQDNTHPHLMRAGLMTALAMGIHNFPEGLATFMAALAEPQLGIFIAIAIAMHNIPEGIAVSMPIFYATGSRKKAFAYSFMSGIAEPVGAIIGYLILMPFMSEAVMGGTMAFIAGIMVYISLDELLPMAHNYGRSHLVIGGVVLGMLVMALTLVVL